jgi:hypothetical protein
MTPRRDPDRLIHDFLMEGQTELPDQVYDAVRADIEQRPQRAAIGPWRTPDMNRYLTVGLAAVAGVALVVVGFNLLPGSPGPGSEPSTSPSVEPSIAPSVAPSAEGFLPEGPFAWFDPIFQSEPRTDVPLITVTIPASGWACPGVGSCILIKGDEWDGDIAPESAMITKFTTSGIHVYQDPCQWEYDLPDPPATTADDIAAALAAQPSRDASDPVDVTVGGYPGKMVTLHVPDELGFSDAGAFTDCFRGVYASYTYGDHDADGTAPTREHQAPGQIDTFWIVEVDGAIVIIDAMYRGDTPAERIEEMRAIAESATFSAPLE